jgi:Rrf2 family transcriptional repressor of oqxAB
MLDLRFPTAVQMMLSLAPAKEEGIERLSSTRLAQSLNANPSLVRTLLVPLVQDGYVASGAGRNGGVRLAKPSKLITLRDIYQSVIGAKGLWSARADVPPQCVVSSNIQPFFNTLAKSAEQTVLDLLGSRTLEDSLNEILALEGARAAHLPTQHSGY